MPAPALNIAILLDSLAELPEPDPAAGYLGLDGFLLGGGSETVRLAVDGLCLEFFQDDVLEIVEIEAGEPAGLAVPVRVRLRCGARLCNISSSAIYASLLARPRLPFAYAVRGSLPDMHEAPQFRALEDAFRIKHGLT